MKQTPARFHWVATLGIAMLMLSSLATSSKLLGAATADCVGKPYGFPGCPTRPTATASSGSANVNCGNAILDAGEECDRGRFNGKTDCSLQCSILFCGDGVLTRDVGEECEPETEEVYVEDEDGNLTTEIRFVEGNQCGWYCQPPICDEAGTCRGGCKLKYAGACVSSASSGAVSSSSSDAHAAAPGSSSSTAGSPAVSSTAATTSSTPAASSPAIPPAPAPAIPVCGDAIVQGVEQCDDGNKNPLDSCTNDCRSPSCGDGIVQDPEECDDANAENLDACSNGCKRARCGDGAVQFSLQEECDDGNTTNDDRCTLDCKLPRCGDGVKQAGEDCDEAAKNSDTAPDSCRRDCKLPRCGDGVTDHGEQCDAGIKNSQTNSDACRTDCRLAYCGDGVLDTSEQCDDGNRIDSDGCTKACKRSICGDGEVQPPEECDAGTLNSNTVKDACRIGCKLPRCGDGVLDTDEECDGGDNCRSTCKFRIPEASSSSVVSSSSSSSKGSLIGGMSLPDLGGPGLALLLGAIGAVVVAVLGFVFRKRLGGLLPFKKLKGIDDIPLDQIEMPWHKW